MRQPDDCGIEQTRLLRFADRATTMPPPNVSTLPAFSKPPVIEVVTGVLFDPLPLTGPLLGKFWLEHLEGFTTSPVEMIPLPSQLEVVERAPPGTMFVGDAPPGPRIWFVNDEGNKVVQLQRDRFLCNWRKTQAVHVYPRFDSVYAFFLEQLRVFEDFSKKTLNAELLPRQFELSYFNHAPGVLPADVAEVLPDLSWRRSQRWLGAPEETEASWSFLLPDKLGRLRVRVQTAQLVRAQEPVLVLELTARGFSEDREQWFQVAHEWIVKAFDDLVSNSMAKVWGREA